MRRQQLDTGAVIDGFTIGEKVHTGGMATVWRVTKPGVDQPIVMKAPNIFEGEDATVIVGFEMEMMILPRLTGKHVPKCYAVGDFATEPYIVMEYIQGYSLFTLLEKAPLPTEEVARLGARVATALVDVHRQNVLHLDIKPSNIMIRDSGDAAFIDFGLSRHLHLPDLLEEEFHVPMGTGPYIAPEQVMKNRGDPRSDIFSLGVVLYYLATGERPFGLPQARSQLKKRFWRDPTPPRKLKPDIPAWLQEAILRCLEVDPSDRYETASQLAFDLSHPQQIKITARGKKVERDGIATAWKRWFRGVGDDGVFAQGKRPAAHAAPIFLVAIDFVDGEAALDGEMRAHVQRVLATTPNARIAFVNVLKLSRLTITFTLDEEGRSIHVQRLVELKEWARPLGLDETHATFHVLEHMDPAEALIEFATANHVDQVIIGARASDNFRRILGSVSSQVVARAPCTVTVVRAPRVELEPAETAAIDADCA